MDVDVWARDRNGSEVNLRRLERFELRALLALDRAIVAAGQGVVLHADELSAASNERNMDRLLRAGEDHAALLGAFVGVHLVASAEVSRLELRSQRHVGAITLGVHPRWQGRGIGRLLLAAALDWGDSVGIERMELNVLADHARAIRLYESAGFVQEGRRRGAFRFEEGRVVDDLLMARQQCGPAEATGADQNGEAASHEGTDCPT